MLWSVHLYLKIEKEREKKKNLAGDVLPSPVLPYGKFFPISPLFAQIIHCLWMIVVNKVQKLSQKSLSFHSTFSLSLHSIRYPMAARVLC
jgi:hypothetical protein